MKRGERAPRYGHVRATLRRDQFNYVKKVARETRSTISAVIGSMVDKAREEARRQGG